MKAVRIHEYGGPEVLVYEEVPKPEPKADQILVRVEAATVNPMDVSVRENRFPTPKQPPKIIGSDGAGVVESSRRRASRPSSRATRSSSAASGWAARAATPSTSCSPRPRPCRYPTASRSPRRRRSAWSSPPPTTASCGAAPCRPARPSSCRARPAASAPPPCSSPRPWARACSPPWPAPPRQTSCAASAPTRSSTTRPRTSSPVPSQLTGGKGVDLVHELVVSVNLPADVRLVATGGRIVCTGQGPSPEATVPIGEALAKDATLLFMNLNNAKRAGVAAIAAEIAQMAVEGKVRPVIGESLPLAEARRAHELLAGAAPRQDRAAAVAARVSTPCRCRGWLLRAPCAASAEAAAPPSRGAGSRGAAPR